MTWMNYENIMSRERSQEQRPHIAEEASLQEVDEWFPGVQGGMGGEWLVVRAGLLFGVMKYPAVRKQW